MKIPDKIKIGGIEYKIEFIDEIKDNIHTSEYIGRVLFREQKIKILNSYPIEKKFRVMLHEIIHVLDEDYKMEINEENLCRLEAGLYQVLKDNDLLKD